MILSRHDSVGTVKASKAFAVSATLLCALLLAGCATESPQYSEPPTDIRAGPSQWNGNDILHVGDPLAFSGLPTSPPFANVHVGEEGNITLPGNQTFVAAGKTRDELGREILERYYPGQAYYFPPQTERWYYVRGEVKSESRQPYPGRTTVLKAIASAGGFTDFARKTKVQLIRPNGSKSIINCAKAIEHPELDLPVNDGDIIFVPRRILY